MVNIDFRSSPSVDEHNAKILFDLKEDETLALGEKGKLTSKKVNIVALSRQKGRPKPMSAGKAFDFDSAVCRGLKTLAEKATIESPKDVKDVMDVFDKVHSRGFVHNPTATQILIEDALQPKIPAVALEERSKYIELCAKLEESDHVTPLMAMTVASNMMFYDPDVPRVYNALLEPRVIEEGTSGVYFVKDVFGTEIGVCKPTSETPYMPDNSHGLTPQALKELNSEGSDEPPVIRAGFEIGGETKCERLSFLVANSLFRGFAPETDVVMLKFPKMQSDPNSKIVTKEASLQAIAKGVAYANCPERHSEVPTKELHKLCILDILIGNNDRHMFNFFYDGVGHAITPIDHGLAMGEDLIPSPQNPLPRSGLDINSFLYDERLSQPIDTDLQSQLSLFELGKVIKELEDVGATGGQVKGLEVRYRALKHGLEKGFNLNQIARMLTTVGKGNGLFSKIQLQLLFEQAKGIDKSDSIFTQFRANPKEALASLNEKNSGITCPQWSFLQNNPQTLKDPTTFFNEVLERFSEVLDTLDPETYLEGA